MHWFFPTGIGVFGLIVLAVLIWRRENRRLRYLGVPLAFILFAVSVYCLSFWIIAHGERDLVRRKLRVKAGLRGNPKRPKSPLGDMAGRLIGICRQPIGK